MFKAKPILIISLICTFPLPNTIALGGVETGNIKARVQANATTIVGASGEIFSSRQVAMTIGMRILAEAVFEAISVKKIVKKDSTSNITKYGLP